MGAGGDSGCGVVVDDDVVDVVVVADSDFDFFPSSPVPFPPALPPSLLSSDVVVVVVVVWVEVVIAVDCGLFLSQS